jgi:hypothetical protein
LESRLKTQLEQHVLASPKFVPLKEELQAAKKMLKMEESQLALNLASEATLPLESLKRVKMAEIKLVLAEYQLDQELQLALKRNLEDNPAINRLQDTYWKVRTALRARSLGYIVFFMSKCSLPNSCLISK